MDFEKDNIAYVKDVQPSGASKTFVEGYADKVRRSLDFKPGGDLFGAVQRLGGEVHYLDLDDWTEVSGSIFVHELGDFDIVLPNYSSPLRDRFTIAHELGHYFLHSKQGEIPLIATRKGTGRAEWEANWFAAALLMPEREFKDACTEYADIDSIATHFGVSRDATKIRRESLGV